MYYIQYSVSDIIIYTVALKNIYYTVYAYKSFIEYLQYIYTVYSVHKLCESEREIM